jgi:hypothetical protein
VLADGGDRLLHHLVHLLPAPAREGEEHFRELRRVAEIPPGE